MGWISLDFNQGILMLKPCYRFLTDLDHLYHHHPMRCRVTFWGGDPSLGRFLVMHVLVVSYVLVFLFGGGILFGIFWCCTCLFSVCFACCPYTWGRFDKRMHHEMNTLFGC